MDGTKKLRSTARRAAGKARRRLQKAPAPDVRPRPQGSTATAPQKPARPPAPKVAVLVVNGFDRRGRWGQFNEDEAREFPWLELCLRQIHRHSRSSSYEVLVWDNSWIPEHKALCRRDDKVRRFEPSEEGGDVRHGASLDNLVKKVRRGTEFIVTLDTDSFPVRDGWLENLTGRLNEDTPVAGVWRDEMLPRKPAFIHPCCLAVRKDTLRQLGGSFTVGSGADVAHNLTLAVEAQGRRTGRLRRSNHWNPHFLMGALYGDLIYHQGAGSRAPMFSAKTDAERDEAVRLALRDAAFSDLDDLVDALAGNVDPRDLPSLAALVAQMPAGGGDMAAAPDAASSAGAPDAGPSA